MSDKIQEQRNFFLVKTEGDLQCVKSNKQILSKLIETLINQGFLDGTNLKDYCLSNKGIAGGFGIVFKAYPKNGQNPTSNDFKAIKCVKFSLTDKLSFIKELQIMMKMNQKNVIKIEKVFSVKGTNMESSIIQFIL